MGRRGKDTAALDGFFTELGEQRAAQLEAISMDMGPAFAKSAAIHAPSAVRCIDPFRAVKAVTDALDQVRRALAADAPCRPCRRGARHPPRATA